MKSICILLAVALMLGACDNGRKAPNGIEVKVIREGQGEFVRPGQFLIMNVSYKTEKDSLIYETKTRNIPIVAQINDSTMMAEEKGLQNAFRVLKKSDSVEIRVSVRSAYEDTFRQPVPPELDPASMLVFNVGVADVTDRDGIMKLQQTINEREMAKYRKQQEEQMAKDTVEIDTYLANNKIQAEKDKSGVRIVYKKKGTGPAPTINNSISVKYRGTLLSDGSQFDASEIPMEWPLARMIEGWQIALQKFGKGTKATLYVPSTLGYGPQGSPPGIPGNANLVFEIELVDVK